MIRPIYETEENTRAEREIATIFADAMGFDVVRPTRKLSEFDFILVSKGTSDVVGIIEVKDRNYTWAELAGMGGVMIDHEKWMMLADYTDSFATAWLVVRAKCGEIRWAKIQRRNRPLLRLTGRSDRNDAQDIGIKVIIQISDFVGRRLEPWE